VCVACPDGLVRTAPPRISVVVVDDDVADSVGAVVAVELA
jgi:hypothetical protein